jgi:hypothetical protein
MKPLLVIAIIFGGAVFLMAWRRRHYILALAVLLIISYELPGAILHQLPLPTILEVAQKIFVEFATEKYINMLAVAVLVTLVSMSFSYVARLPRRRVTRTAKLDPAASATDFVPLASALLVFGLISVGTNAGQIRLLDYEGLELRTIPVYGYGLLLLVVIGILLIWAAEQRRVWALIALLLVAAPISYEAFISSKRQIFAPLILEFLLYFLYSPRIKKKLLWISGSAALMLGFFAVQFLARIELGAVDIGDTPIELLLLPQLGEFIGVGSTTLYSLALVDSRRVAYGVNLALALLNSVPYAKLGTLFFPEQVSTFADFQKQLAPYGAFSTMAEAWWTFQWLGIVLLGVFLGLLLRAAHRQLRIAFSTRVSLDSVSVYWLCLTASLFVKYRSGIGDMIQTTVAFSLLYWALVIPGILLRRSFTASTLARIEIVPDVPIDRMT